MFTAIDVRQACCVARGDTGSQGTAVEENGDQPMTRPTSPRTRRHPLFARFYSKIAGPALDRAGATEHRESLLAGLTGEVIEVGAGNGLNFAHYPKDVQRGPSRC